MTKFSGITPNSSPSLSDYLVGVTAGGVDDRVTMQNLINLFFANIPSGAITLATATTGVNVSFTTSTTGNGTTLSPTLTFTAPGNKRCRVLLFGQDVYQQAGTAAYDIFKFWDGPVGTGIALGTFQKGNVPLSTSLPCYGMAEWTPTAGSHTINLSCLSAGAGNTVIIEPSASMGMILKVELIP